jgi:quercetin dioxygenase-like cupin family protein
MMHSGGPVIVRPSEGATIEGPVGGPLTFKARGEQTNGTFTALENVIPPGQGPPLHTHVNEDEAWYMLEGELRFELDGELRAPPRGSFVFVPRGAPHCFQNTADTPARILVMFIPSGMEQFFDQFEALSAPDPQAFARIGDPRGMKISGPPLAQSDPH